jgi:hypothetical protein
LLGVFDFEGVFALNLDLEADLDPDLLTTFLADKVFNGCLFCTLLLDLLDLVTDFFEDLETDALPFPLLFGGDILLGVLEIFLGDGFLTYFLYGDFELVFLDTDFLALFLGVLDLPRFSTGALLFDDFGAFSSISYSPYCTLLSIISKKLLRSSFLSFSSSSWKTSI